MTWTTWERATACMENMVACGPAAMSWPASRRLLEARQDVLAALQGWENHAGLTAEGSVCRRLEVALDLAAVTDGGNGHDCLTRLRLALNHLRSAARAYWQDTAD